MTDTVEGTAIELPVADHELHDPPASTAVVRRERRSEVIRPLDPDQLVDSFQAYQSLLPRLLDASDWQGTGTDRFVKKSGWRKIATAFDLDVQMVSERVEYDHDGTPLRAIATARAISPSGRAMDGDGRCTLSEFIGKRRHDPKLESNMSGTAATRAKNRAISDLVGMGQVSAEEVTAGGAPHADPGPPYGPPITEATKLVVGGAAKALVDDGDEDLARELIQHVRNELGYIPQAAAVALLIAAGQEVPK